MSICYIKWGEQTAFIVARSFNSGTFSVETYNCILKMYYNNTPNKNWVANIKEKLFLKMVLQLSGACMNNMYEQDER